VNYRETMRVRQAAHIQQQRLGSRGEMVRSSQACISWMDCTRREKAAMGDPGLNTKEDDQTEETMIHEGRTGAVGGWDNDALKTSLHVEFVNGLVLVYGGP
jgi:hypothetical protein